MKPYRRAVILAASLAFAFASPLAAQTSPFVPGEYVEVSSISVDDGHNLDYANFLAGQWRDRQEYAKSQGWITGYEVLSNVNKRHGEPDLIMVVRRKNSPDSGEQQRRDAAMREHTKQTDVQMAAASGDRAKYRHQMGSQLWQVLNFK